MNEEVEVDFRVQEKDDGSSGHFGDHSDLFGTGGNPDLGIEDLPEPEEFKDANWTSQVDPTMASDPPVEAPEVERIEMEPMDPKIAVEQEDEGSDRDQGHAGVLVIPQNLRGARPSNTGYNPRNSLHSVSDFPGATQECLFKVLLIGDPGVGKTSFVQRYTNNIFRSDYKGTVGVDFALKVLRVNRDTTVKLQLWDVAGQERFTWMTRVYYRDSRGCIIMFDLANRKSFLSVAKWKRDLDSKCSLPDGSPVPCLLLANKCDLRERSITIEEIERLYQDLNFMGWTETSAKTDTMVKDSVKYLVDTMVKYEQGQAQVQDRAAYHLDRLTLQPDPERGSSGFNPAYCLFC